MNCGSVPEVVEDGVTGYVCDSLQEFLAAVPRVGALNREACRASAMQRFSSACMTDGYEAIYAAAQANDSGVVEMLEPRVHTARAVSATAISAVG